MIYLTSIKVRFLLLLLNFISVLAVGACDRSPRLNSERIAQQFGSYGVEILRADADRRVSRLYSEDNGRRTTRTLARVEFDDAANSAIVNEHRIVLDGGSIGSVFKENGWTVSKETLQACAREFDTRMQPFLGGMRLEWPAILAVHQYRFRVSRGGQRIDYATITEIHHPEYLDYSALTEIFPDPGADCETD